VTLGLQDALPPASPRAEVVVLEQLSSKVYQEASTIPEFPTYETRFLQSNANLPLVDILIVIDNSGSMTEEQAKLAERMKPLLSRLSNTDWRIQVITTDTPCPTRPYLPLDRDSPDVEKNFVNAIKVGVNGSATEQGLLMAFHHLSGTKYGNCQPQPQSWLRPKAKLAMFFLSDEDEQSQKRAADLIKLLEEKEYTPGKDAKAYGIIWHPDKPCSSAVQKGTHYAKLIEDTKGLWGDICASDYTKILSDISLDISNFFFTDIPLAGHPVMSSVQVGVNGSPFSGNWFVVNGSLFLEETLAPGDWLEASYKLEAVQFVALRGTSQTPDWIEVYVNGLLLESHEYHYAASEKGLRFVRAFADGEQVEIKYGFDAELRKEFPFPKKRGAEVSCHIGTEIISPFYSYDEGLIIFDVAPPEGVQFTCLY
jgi:hypothetical protein